MLRHRLDEHRDALACPRCVVSMTDGAMSLDCPSCHTSYEVRDGVPYLRLDAPDETEVVYHSGWKGRIRSHPRLWALVRRLLVPVLDVGPDPVEVLGSLATDGIVIDSGAGNDRRHARFLSVDLIGFPEVDVVADVLALPFHDGSVAGIASTAVLEHTPEPAAMLREAARVLRDDGRLFLIAPFLQPFHAAPHDYMRWTAPALRKVVEDAGFAVRDVGIHGGPASMIAWNLAEFVALLLSFGSRRLRAVLSPLFQVVFSPLKWLDLLLARFDYSSDLASALYVDAQKKRS